MRATEVG